MPAVIITHPKTGESYGINSADFRRGQHYVNAKGERQTYEEAGFRIVSLADGQPYTPPAPRPSPGEHSAP